MRLGRLRLGAGFELSRLDRPTLRLEPEALNADLSQGWRGCFLRAVRLESDPDWITIQSQWIETGQVEAGCAKTG